MVLLHPLAGADRVLWASRDTCLVEFEQQCHGTTTTAAASNSMEGGWAGGGEG